MKLEIKRPEAVYVLTFEMPHGYFSVTHDAWMPGKRRVDRNLISCGAGVMELLNRIDRPDLAKIVRWHLCHLESGPMYYKPNAVYWAEFIAGVSRWERWAWDPDPTDAFKSHVVFGAVEGDEMPKLEGLSREEVRDTVTAWCDARFSKLQAQMRVDLAEIIAEYPG